MDGSPLKADQVILNANIITIDPKRPGVEALAILQGRFIAMGNNQDMAGLIGQDTQVLDLTGDGFARIHRCPHSRFEQRYPSRHGRRL